MQLHNSYYDLGSDFYKKQQPQQVSDPQLIIFNDKLASSLNLDLKDDKNNLAEIFSGNKLLPNSKPIALAYAGHQFGNFVNQLGDGRAVLLGDVIDNKKQRQDIQLKGSGISFFSRGGDGKCPLDAAIREYLLSEAMHYLKIATTRSLALVKTNKFIQRQNIVPQAIITRVAQSHIRIGTFEYFAARNDLKNIKKLANYAIKRHFSQFENDNDKYFKFLEAVIQKQLNLVSSWMSIGFIHGVMNSDNTTISGQTIDYGPCAFMDEYNANQCFSYIDKMGRYSFSNQKNIILWNLIQLARTLLPLIDNKMEKALDIVEAKLSKFSSDFDKNYYNKMAKKIGIFDFKNTSQDKKLIDDFLNILQSNKIDFTNGFRILSDVIKQKSQFFTQDNNFKKWQKDWQKTLKRQNLTPTQISNKINKINPILIPRNHIIANIIDKAILENNFDQFHDFLEAIKQPFKYNKKYSKYYEAVTDKNRVHNTFCGT